MTTMVVTGGAGFIGSAVIRMLITKTDYTVVNLDKLTYAGNLETLEEVASDRRYVFEKVDICDGSEVSRIFRQYKPEKILHLAAESHVDRSIDGPSEFVNTNIVGTYMLLENAREYWRSLNADDQRSFRFHHVSTDEVYGSLGHSGYFTEQTPYQPNSPYSASKASSDHLVRAWHETYGMPTIITNCSNNYGPYQYPEKLIPLMISKAVSGEALPVYGKGDNIRDWLYVEDHARALWEAALHGMPGEVYNIGGDSEMTNIEVVESICNVLNEITPLPDKGDYKKQIRFVKDRPGHDHRYAIDASKIRDKLGWRPRESFASGLRKTIQWYLDNPSWYQVVSKSYTGERLGTRT